MTLDEVMAVWRSQDAAPLHDVNETMLWRALRGDETMLQRADEAIFLRQLQKDEKKLRWRRRSELWGAWFVTAFILAFMAPVVVWLAFVRLPSPDIWNFAPQAVLIVAMLFWAGFLHVTHRAQARRERRFGDSLRDQLRRQIAQIEYDELKATSLTHRLVRSLPMTVTLGLLLWYFPVLARLFGALAWFVLSVLVFVTVSVVALQLWAKGNVLRGDLLPEKRRLEALLRELDDQE